MYRGAVTQIHSAGIEHQYKYNTNLSLNTYPTGTNPLGTTRGAAELNTANGIRVGEVLH